MLVGNGVGVGTSVGTAVNVAGTRVSATTTIAEGSVVGIITDLAGVADGKTAVTTGSFALRHPDHKNKPAIKAMPKKGAKCFSLPGWYEEELLSICTHDKR